MITANKLHFQSHYIVTVLGAVDVTEKFMAMKLTNSLGKTSLLVSLTCFTSSFMRSLCGHMHLNFTAALQY